MTDERTERLAADRDRCALGIAQDVVTLALRERANAARLMAGVTKAWLREDNLHIAAYLDELANRAATLLSERTVEREHVGATGPAQDPVGETPAPGGEDDGLRG